MLCPSNTWPASGAPMHTCLPRLFCRSVMQQSKASRGLEQLAALMAEGKVKAHVDRWAGMGPVPHVHLVRLRGPGLQAVGLLRQRPRSMSPFAHPRSMFPMPHSRSPPCLVGCTRWKSWRLRTSMQSRATCAAKSGLQSVTTPQRAGWAPRRRRHSPRRHEGPLNCPADAPSRSRQRTTPHGT